MDNKIPTPPIPIVQKPDGVTTAPLLESEVGKAPDDLVLREKEKELSIKEREITLKEEEIRAKINLEKRGMWFSSPLLLGIATAIFGLVSAGIGAALQGYSNFQLERQKFEFSLILKALEIKDRTEAARQLSFLVESGVIQSLDGTRIKRLAENPDQLPILINRSAVQSNGFLFDLQGCGRKGETIECVFLITSPEKDNKLYLYSNSYSNRSGITDIRGNEYIAKGVELGNLQSIDSVNLDLLQNIPIRARLIFEAPEEVNKIAMIEIACSNQASEPFRVYFLDLSVSN
jgi:hypothetical protein